MPELRSAQWYSGADRNAYIHRAWMRRGLPNSAFEGRPQIAIANTASDLTPCNSHLNEVAEHVKQGVWEAGGVPLNLPVVSLGETQVRPTAMLWRNMAAMAAEEMLRANPVDGVVLLGGCDKTIPALLMAAASVNLPAVVVPGGPMLTGTFRGGSFRNAIVALAAAGGSTNAVVHLLAIAGRLGVPLSLTDFDRIAADVPLLVNLQPAGKYLMDDLHRAGGLAAVLREVVDLLDPEAIDVTGRPLVDSLVDARIWDRDVIRARDTPLQPAAGIAVLYGNLAPAGAIIKPAAASPHLMRHRGRAVVFDSIEDLHARIDSPDLDVDADSVLVLRGCGPRGYPGMPEVANLPLPP